VPAPTVYLFATFGVALVAAAFDWRTGRIPNVLTVAALLVAVPLHAFLSASGHTIDGIESSALGAAVVAVPCLVGWRFGWVAGGDVKLIAAMGALGGLSSGLESVFFSLLFASAYVFLRLSWDGVFFRTLGNGIAVAATRTLFRGGSGGRGRLGKIAVVPRAELTSSLRFGPFALAGAAISLVLHGGS
jgi:prepilin peptidase CpaA